MEHILLLSYTHPYTDTHDECIKKLLILATMANTKILVHKSGSRTTVVVNSAKGELVQHPVGVVISQQNRVLLDPKMKYTNIFFAQWLYLENDAANEPFNDKYDKKWMVEILALRNIDAIKNNRVAYDLQVGFFEI